MQYVVEKSGVISLGRQGEHLARTLLFPLASVWERELGPGTVQAVFQPPGGATPYPVPLERTADGWVWPVTASDTAVSGRGRCELRYLAGEAVVRSRIYTVYVTAALGHLPDGQVDPWQRYLDQVLEARAAAQTAADQAAAAADDAKQAAAAVDAMEEVTNLELLKIWNGGNEHVEEVSR